MKILIAEDENELLSLFADIANGAISNATVLRASTFSEAKKYLETQRDIDLLVCDENLGDGLGSSLQEWNAKNGSNIPFVFTAADASVKSPFLDQFPPYGVIHKPDIVSPFLKLLEKRRTELSAPPARSEAEEVEVEQVPDGSLASSIPEYCSISLWGLLRANTIPCDLYIKLSDQKFIKIMNSGELFGEADAHHYTKKNVEMLYVHRNFYASLLNHITANIFSLIEARDATPDDAIEAGTLLHRTVQQHLQHLGLTQEAQEAIRSHMKLATKLVRQSDELKQLLRRMRVEPKAYLNSHSSTLSFFAGAMLAMMPWRSETGYFKLALAGIIHDITLENHELAGVDTLEELAQKTSRFTTREIDQFRRHPQDAAELVRIMESVPPDVDSIVLQHHEKPDGTGFPHKLNSLRISPLSALFIVAHDIVRKIHQDENFDIKSFLLNDRPEYNYGPFKRILRDARAHLTQAEIPPANPLGTV